MKTISVDDRQLAVNAMVETLKELDPEGSHAGLISAEEALSFAKTHPLDVAFLDIEMPGMNGLVLAKKMKELQPQINIVFVTGHMEYAFDAHKLFASGYLIKPADTEDVAQVLHNLRHPLHREKARIRVRCFGTFDVYIDDRPVEFKRTKSKEVFAYLIDSRGCRVTMGEIMGILWEDGEKTESRNSQIRMFISDIRDTFAKAGFPEMIVKEYNAIGVRTEGMDCDYFRFLDGDPAAVNEYMGEYMKQYSWSEMRVGDLEKF